jgi:hypothetical protein
MKKFRTRPTLSIINTWTDKNLFFCLFAIECYFNKNNAGYVEYSFRLGLLGFILTIDRKFY